jgi:hypothetical protein
MNYIEDIQKALDIALKQFGVDNGIIVALADDDYVTDTSIPYLSSNNINTGATTADLGTTDIRSGFYQIDINYKFGSKSSLINSMADKLNAIFHSGSSFSFGGACVGIDDVVPDRIIVGGGWAKMPLTVNWFSYTAKI